MNIVMTTDRTTNKVMAAKDWLDDFVIQFLTGSKWRETIDKFIDDESVVFGCDDEDDDVITDVYNRSVMNESQCQCQHQF